MEQKGKVKAKSKSNKQFDIHAIEKKWQEYWKKEQIYEFDFESRKIEKVGNKKEIFSIDTPPPTVSADHLHVGHAMHYSQFEFIARFKRMQGCRVLFPMGFDDNGLPTEKYTEEKHNINIQDVSKEEFRKLCFETATKVIKEGMQPFFVSLGFSCQWPAYRTISEKSQEIAQLSFLDLHKKGYLYRAEEPVLWCPYHQTALAQATVEDKKRITTLNYIYFDVDFNADFGEDGINKKKIKKNKKVKKITIATTRPELLSSCVAVFVHPDDKRYKNLIGKKAKVPLFNLKVPILADKDVIMDFGTGIVMCCTFGDSADVTWWRRYKLPICISLTKDGRLNKNAGKYAGLTVNDARAKIIQNLENENLIDKQEKIEQTVGVCWRCHHPIELIPTKQWFVKILPLKKQLIQQAKKIKWHPSYFIKRYEDWVSNLGWNWCISRQRYYGVAMPVWYCKKCNKVMLPAEKELPIDPLKDKPKKACSCGGKEFIPEKDVFDTWFTSSLTPELAAGWNSGLLPFSLRPQAHDIIRTWAFYTITKAFMHRKEIPWKEIMMSGFGLASNGKPMHKSLGNAVWVNPILEKYGADSLRYWAASSKLGEDASFQEKELLAGQRTIIKLWNASKFVSMHLTDLTSKPTKPKLEVFDKWLLAKLNNFIVNCTKHFEQYQYSKVRTDAEQFFWRIFCDNYLEIIKKRLYEPKTEQEKKSAQYGVYQALLSIIKIFAPIMPHITEEIYQQYFKKYEKIKSIHISEWPKPCENGKDGGVDKQIEKLGDEAIEIISEVRQFKTKAQKSLKAEIILTLEKEKIKTLKLFMDDIKAVASVKEIKVGKFSIKFA